MQIIRAAATDTVKGNAAYEIHDKRKETGKFHDVTGTF